MRYFTRKFVDGSLSEVRRTRAIKAYADSLLTLRLSPSLRMLAKLDLHDARTLAATHDNVRKHLELEVSHGDLQTGYRTTKFLFNGAVIEARSLRLLQKAVQDAGAEILATELSHSAGRFEFRCLLWPKGEAKWQFTALKMRSKATRHRRLRPATRGDSSQITTEELMHVFKDGSARLKR